MKFRCLLVATLFAVCGVWVADASKPSLDVIPLPRSVEQTEGQFFRFDDNTTVYCSVPQLRRYLGDYLPTYSWRSLRSRVEVRINPSLGVPKEGYVLSVTPERVVVEGADYAGTFYGVQTLLQMFPAEVYEGGFRSPCSIPCVKITDWPEYPYRGQHLDVARTFVPIEGVKEFVDHLSRYKINRLHLHLTDDQGWRVEIKSHPELTSIGAWRGGDSPIWAVYGSFEEKYGGFYTQAELRDLVAYAAERAVTVIPEIDLPGHSLAVGKVYPEVLCPVERDNTAAAGYDRRNVWCVSREENYALLDDIFRELADVFPSEWVHIGGDEVNMRQWKECPHCSALYNQKGFTSYAQLEAHFLNRVVEIVGRYGKLPVVWNEAINGGNLTKDALVCGWDGIKPCHKATAEGYRTVIMTAQWFYFDMRQSAHEWGHNWAGIVTAEKCYSIDLIEQGFSEAQMAVVEGFEGAFWSEIHLAAKPHFENYVEYMTFPRVCAVAEVGWTPQDRREWSDFSVRLVAHGERMEAMGISYRREAPQPPQGRQITPKMTVTTSLPMSKSEALGKLSAYANDWGYTSKRTCKNGDWVLYEFADAIDDVEVELTTGYRHVVRGMFPTGVVEVSANGIDFRHIADLYNGSATIHITRPVKAIRLRSTATGNGDSFVFLQHPLIRREKNN
ncbi:MAG: beta-N-acetylhexosaminidase [Tidjanibacter sp.]|nr:beta-N-acetylhexosaminidase [Tidjanibacter sp.]